MDNLEVNKNTTTATATGALDGGVLILHVDFKKAYCRPVEFKNWPCCPIDLRNVHVPCPYHFNSHVPCH